MSIVPYNSHNEIVFHDPANEILVIHDSQENTIQLVRALPFESSDHDAFSSRALEWPDSEHRYGPEQANSYCPHCGHSFAENSRSGFRRRSSNSTYTELDLRNYDYVPLPFLHHDYFKLLANLPLGGRSIALSDSLPLDIFNQGYFERFFRKVPPGILGSGAHAQVYKVMHVLKNIQLGVYAVKRINIGDHVLFLDHVLNEVLILYELSAQGANENNLIRYNHVWMEMGSAKDLNTILLNRNGEQSGLNDEVPYVYILQQYCDGGHLENMIAGNFQTEKYMSAKERIEHERQRRRLQREHPSMPESAKPQWLSDFEIWKFCSDITRGVLYLHSHGILHRDLKPSNCLLDKKYAPSLRPFVFESAADLENAADLLPKVLVSDFGEGKFIDKQRMADLSLHVDEERRGNTGTIEFTDPKLWVYSHYSSGRKLAYEFTKSSDMYSLGMIFCYLCAGCLPFEKELTDRTDPEKIRNDIAKWHSNLLPESFHEWFSDNVIRSQGAFSECQQDFNVLIYMLIKESSTFTAQDTMAYLQNIKWRRLIDNGELAAIDEIEKPTSVVSEIVVPRFQLPLANGIFQRRRLSVFAYLVDLALLETADATKSVRLAKCLNLAGLAVEAIAPDYLSLHGAAIGVLITAVAWGYTKLE